MRPPRPRNLTPIKRGGSADPPPHAPGLTAIQQQMIRQHQRHHRLADRNRPDTDTRIMPPLGDQIDLLAPRALIVRREVRMLEVGLTAKRHTTGWPLEIPPKIPPA